MFSLLRFRRSRQHGAHNLLDQVDLQTRAQREVVFESPQSFDASRDHSGRYFRLRPITQDAPPFLEMRRKRRPVRAVVAPIASYFKYIIPERTAVLAYRLSLDGSRHWLAKHRNDLLSIAPSGALPRRLM